MSTNPTVSQEEGRSKFEWFSWLHVVCSVHAVVHRSVIGGQKQLVVGVDPNSLPISK